MHLVCHSHQDPGWLKTYDQGFLGTRNDYHVRINADSCVYVVPHTFGQASVVPSCVCRHKLGLTSQLCSTNSTASCMGLWQIQIANLFMVKW